MRPKVLLGCPTFEGKEYCLDFWVKGVREIQKTFQCDILLIDNSKSSRYSNLIKNKYKIKVLRSKYYKEKPLQSMTEARKKLFAYTTKNKYDYLFSLEQDLFPPKDIIKTLIKIRKKIKKPEAVVGASYLLDRISEEKPPYLEKDHLTNIGIDRKYNKKARRKIQRNLTLKELKRKKKMFQVFNVAFGCSLIDASILKKIKLNSLGNKRPDDVYFSLECHKKKIPIYTDSSLTEKVIHIPGNSIDILKWAN